MLAGTGLPAEVSRVGLFGGLSIAASADGDTNTGEIRHISSGTTSSSALLPTKVGDPYSFTQQIYTSAEIGEAGMIESIGCKSLYTASFTRKLDIYMVNTDKTAFSSENDWIAVSDSDKVFSRSVTFAVNGWMTIELDTPFSYDGTSNVAAIVDDNSRHFELEIGDTGFSIFSASENCSLYSCTYNPNANIDPKNPGSDSVTFHPAS